MDKKTATKLGLAAVVAAGLATQQGCINDNVLNPDRPAAVSTAPEKPTEIRISPLSPVLYSQFAEAIDYCLKNSIVIVYDEKPRLDGPRFESYQSSTAMEEHLVRAEVAAKMNQPQQVKVELSNALNLATEEQRTQLKPLLNQQYRQQNQANKGMER